MKPETQTFHVGMAPFLDANGRRRASYQILNAHGQAIATCDLCDGLVTRLHTLPYVDPGAFMAMAKHHDNTTEPLAFPHHANAL